MITIRSGKLTIPEDERFVGFAGDNTSEEKYMVIENRVVPNSIYTLYLRFDDGQVSSIILPSQQVNTSVLLTWDIQSEHIKSPGIITAQLKMTDSRGNSIHSTRDYFLAGYPAEDSGSGGYDPSDLERLEESIAAVEARLPYVESGGVYVTDDGGDIRIARYSDVYSKGEIDGMIGDIEAQLATV